MKKDLKKAGYSIGVLAVVVGVTWLFSLTIVSENSQQAATKVGTERTTLCVPSAAVHCGRITITKDTNPNNEQDFSFTHNVPGFASPFTLDDDGTSGNPLNNNITLVTPYNGVFTVTEVFTPGYAVSINCNDQTMDTTISGTSANVSITNGETVFCTFTNKRKVVGQVPVDPMSNPKPIGSNDLPVKACSNTWNQKANVGNISRQFAVGFSIGTKGYIGTGSIPNNNNVDSSDFWEYDSQTNTWTQIADFIGPARKYAVGFSIGSNGYVGTGNSGWSQYHNDFYMYDSVANAWSQKASFPGLVRAAAVGFSIGSKGYIGLGHNGYLNSVYNDFWEFDPGLPGTPGAWSQKQSFSGPSRANAVGFSVGNKGYVGTGYISPGTYLNDFWEFDPNNGPNGTWSQKADFDGVPRLSATGFSIGSNGYIGTGRDSSGTLLSDFWEYDPITNSWNEKADFVGAPRGYAVGFSIGNNGYLGTGLTEQSDFWQYCL